MNPRDITSAMHRKVRRIHFVGIGGIGMSGIAEVLLNLGYGVSGSDLAPSDTTQRLSALGAAIHAGHAASHVGGADVVVTSTAVRPDNPEVLEAHRKAIPVIPRAEMLAELLKMKFSIAVSGSHGKTTTTSMIAAVLAHGGLDPTMVIGGKVGSIGGNARLGHGEIVVAEADESDGSFLHLAPSLAVITNIDREHLDHYRDIHDIRDAFVRFANLVPFYGCAVACIDAPHVRDILPRIQRRTVTYGTAPSADYMAGNIRLERSFSGFTLCRRGAPLGDVRLRSPGLFNILNALAAAAVARELDLPFPVIREGLETFGGVQRRLETRGEAGGILWVDDYGHHPTEIRATLAAARQRWKQRLLVVFQPHRYTRTQALFDDFVAAFGEADLLVLTDIYAASEDPLPGVHAQRLAEAIRRRGQDGVEYLSRFEDIAARLEATARPGDVILTLGAGNVWKVGELWRRRRKDQTADPLPGTREQP